MAPGAGRQSGRKFAVQRHSGAGARADQVQACAHGRSGLQVGHAGTYDPQLLPLDAEALGNLLEQRRAGLAAMAFLVRGMGQ